MSIEETEAQKPFRPLFDCKKDKTLYLIHELLFRLFRLKLIVFMIFLGWAVPDIVFNFTNLLPLKPSVLGYVLIDFVFFAWFFGGVVRKLLKYYENTVSDFGPVSYRDLDASGIVFHSKKGENLLSFSDVTKVEKFIRSFRILTNSQKLIILFTRHLTKDEIEILNSFAKRKQ